MSCSVNKTLNFYWFQSGNLNLKNNTMFCCIFFFFFKNHPFKDMWMAYFIGSRDGAASDWGESQPPEVEAFQGVGQLSDCKQLQAEGVAPPSRPRRKYDMGFQEQKRHGRHQVHFIVSNQEKGGAQSWHCLVRTDRPYIHFLSGSLFLFPLLHCHYAVACLSSDQLSCLLVCSSLPSSSPCFLFKYGSLSASSSLKLMSLLLPPPPTSFTASSAFS